ncbi:MAG: ComEC/Rec2 family competence protein, partial [Woeseiaceae bacterium]
MVRACLCLLAGAMALQLSSFPPDSDHFVVLLVAWIALHPVIRRRDLVVIACGAVLFWTASMGVLEARLDPAYEGDSMLADIRITAFPRRNTENVSFIATPLGDARIPENIRLSWADAPVQPRIGDVWRAEIKLRRPRGTSNPGSMDVEAWLFRERILATGYVVTGPHIVLLDSMTETGVDGVRSRFVAHVRATLGDRSSAAVIMAIAVGARHEITREQWDRYAASGTSHLMAISGLHIGLAALAAYAGLALLLVLSPVRNPHVVALCVALIFAAGYAALTGFAVPARRALLMLVLVCVGIVTRRNFDGGRILAATALSLVILDPLSTMQPGFLLSFAAVSALLWWSRTQQRPRSAWRAYATAQLVLGFALLPLTVVLFARMSFVAPLLNLVAVPVFSVVTVPMSLLSVVLPGDLSVVTLELASLSIELVELLISAAIDWPGASVRTAAIDSFAIVIVVLPVLFLLPAGVPGRYLA